jgi:dihydroxy-acid dehydratase
VTGKTLGENIAGAEVHNDDVIRTVENAIYREGALAVLKGNLAPDGCVIKPSACDPRFLKHAGPALVFDDYASMKKAVDDPNLDVSADHVLILRNAGPQGGPGMPEWGMLPIPTRLVKHGVRDMVRLSDARMSGTSYGACILHVSPESFVGGPLALVKNGDMITLDVAARTINLDAAKPSLPGAAPRGNNPIAASNAAMAGCFPNTSSRPMKVAISISWRPALAGRSTSRRFIDAVDPGHAQREPGTHFASAHAAR